jgi:23S rRNA (cytidine2498-2'-O)-methyltransferase
VPRHVFATCQIGVERHLKAEVARTRRDLRPAFARPGLVTWVAEAEVAPEVELDAVFARVWGASLGRGEEAIALVPDGARLHVFARDPAETVGVEAARGALLAAADAARFAAEPAPAVGDLVADVIVAPSEPWLVGLHRHRAGRWRAPGGLPGIVVPPESPSRAYAKIEEAIAWAELDVRAGQVALEIGAAPGGAAYALAKRGLEVWGADPGAMDPAVLALGVHHLPVKIGALRWEDLPPRVDWLLVDVHLAPRVALHEVSRLMKPLRKTLRGAVLTLKLNDQPIVDDLPGILERVRALGFTDVRATHLPSNRREVCCVATT